MSYHGPTLIKDPELRWPIVVLAAIITMLIALIVAGLNYLAMNQRPVDSYSAPLPVWTLRSGQDEFERYRKDIVIGQLESREQVRPFNNVSVELTALVTNRTNRVISGLEMRGAILDAKSSIVRQRTVTIVPEQQKLLEVDETITVRFLLARMHEQADRSQRVLEVTGIRFE